MNHNSHFLSLKLIQKCPACNSQFQQTTVTILEESDFSLLAHLHCLNCHVNLLANVVTMPQGLVGNAILIDLRSDEAPVILARQALTEDDWLNLYQQVSNKQFINSLSDPQALGRIDNKKE
ncbi:MAG: hypothetical protein V1846_02385 [Candidatus Komeilibacteria bacterium]